VHLTSIELAQAVKLLSSVPEVFGSDLNRDTDDDEDLSLFSLIIPDEYIPSNSSFVSHSTYYSTQQK
jgi:hypothetical protein